MLEALIASLMTSLPSALVFAFGRPREEVLHGLMSFGAGMMMGTVIFHFLPEIGGREAALAASILLFFALEKALHWHGCKEGKCGERHVGWMIVLGDALHNFIDGMAIYGAFLSSTAAGISTAVSILFHEIPQELGDMAILLRSGFSRKKAMLSNFLSSLSSAAGVIVAWLLKPAIGEILIPLVAGSFIYISMADLTPEMHKHGDRKWLIHLAGFALGLFFPLVFG